jgi:pyruvate,orthophosphate dikinase
LHEFLPKDEAQIIALAQTAGLQADNIRARIRALHETNPMLGHRGVRLGISYPEITAMQVHAILEATAIMIRKRKKVFPEIMIPVTMNAAELEHQRKIILTVHDELCRHFNIKKIPFHFGTMIETPRASLCAGDMAAESDFFSFGTNDLTQMTMGISRDDVAGFLPEYLKEKIMDVDPFMHIDREGVGQLISMAIVKGKKTNHQLEIGCCGEHAGDAISVDFFVNEGFDYVSCSPYRVPIARLAAAQSAIAGKKVKLPKQRVQKPR